jgi:Holliday junction resolvase-like predicted endonuclease
MNNHDSLIDYVEAELGKRGITNTFRNIEYSRNCCGEIDLYAVKGDYVLLFEMKTNNSYKSRNKALKQLSRARLNCFPDKRVFSFYVSNYNSPKVEWVKKYE